MSPTIDAISCEQLLRVAISTQHFSAYTSSFVTGSIRRSLGNKWRYLLLSFLAAVFVVRTALGTLRHQDSSALNYSAEVSRHFGTDLYETLRHHCIFV